MEDICVVNTVINVALLKESSQFTTFGVDIVMASCSDVFYERTRFSTNINLHYINSTVTHIRNREVDYTISSKEREGAVVTRALVADGIKIGKNAVVGDAASENIELVAKRVKGDE